MDKDDAGFFGYDKAEKRRREAQEYLVYSKL